MTIIKLNHTARTEHLENAQIFESIIQYSNLSIGDVLRPQWMSHILQFPHLYTSMAEFTSHSVGTV